MAVIELNGICSGYGKSVVLRELSVAFERAQLTAVIGPNGCGKSTLVKTILGLLPCSLGEITVDGVNLVHMKRKEIARRMAYLPQGGSVPDMTVFEMVLHGRFPHTGYPGRYSARDREIAMEAIERIGIAKVADAQLRTLSGGMRQNASVAMALAQEADYILLDEPTTYLDVSHQVALVKTLRELAENGRGIVAVMHDLPLAFTFADRIAVMNEGRVVSVGSPDDVCESGITEALFGVSLCKTAEGGYCIRY